jgi:hypothetical protein
VDPHGAPLKAKLELFKQFDTPLWPGNPTGQSSFGERIHSVASSDGNGRFVWHVNPSTRPEVAEHGATESYRLLVRGRNFAKVVRVEVARGEVVNLGKLRLKRRPMTLSIAATAREPI